MQVKFAACACSAAEEDWELVESPKATGADYTLYECASCGESQRYSIDPFTALR